MVSTISFIQANLHSSITAYRVFSRTTAVKGMDMALIQEPSVSEGCFMGLNIPFCGGRIDREHVSLSGT